MRRNKIQVLDWDAFMNEGRCVVIKKKKERKIQINKHKVILTVGAITITLLSTIPLPPDIVHAATELVTTGTNGTWDKLVGGLVKLLDPVAKVFGVIAGIAIMTGNGKIGIERLFWLSIGYLTARKVEDWIEFLNNL